MADYVRRLAATRAPPPQRANVGFYEAAARVNCVPLVNVVPSLEVPSSFYSRSDEGEP
jgi:hypothetical protein